MKNQPSPEDLELRALAKAERLELRSFACKVCPPGPDGEDKRHGKWPYAATHSHESVTHIVNEGLLESRWWMFTKGIRRQLALRSGDNKPTWLLDLIEQDGHSRHGGRDYHMTRKGSK